MNAAGTSTVVRIAGAVLVLAIAAALGLAVGTALNQLAGDQAAAPGPNIGGFVPDNQGGTENGAIGASVAEDWPDYGLRQLSSATDDEWPDYGIRHLESAPSDDGALRHEGLRKRAPAGFSTQDYADLHEDAGAAVDEATRLGPAPR